MTSAETRARVWVQPVGGNVCRRCGSVGSESRRPNHPIARARGVGRGPRYADVDATACVYARAERGQRPGVASEHARVVQLQARSARARALRLHQRDTRLTASSGLETKARAVVVGGGVERERRRAMRGMNGCGAAQRGRKRERAARVRAQLTATVVDAVAAPRRARDLRVAAATDARTGWAAGTGARARVRFSSLNVPRADGGSGVEMSSLQQASSRVGR
ncbi:hypothetical protein GGX14DRAFT_407867 [Mycena pura]|uniref:Uncharacterized protein n=1 Tax=Mycena pura TaxID=153505 RepID=A0AAD6UP17_9AGAR|nr:hypothetical protein GGX14DRAFT_407867 [Mycena pura]